MSNKKHPTTRILPVFDLLRGRVVHAVAGERNVYQPVDSKLVDSSDPEAVAVAFRDRFEFAEAYVADLDAIAGLAPDWESIHAIGRAGFGIWLDAGLQTVEQAIQLSEQSVALGPNKSILTAVVAGSETVPGFRALNEMLDAVGPERLVFSLDLKGGQPLKTNDHWQNKSPAAILESVLELGIRRFLILDLALVGTEQGIGTELLCQTLRAMSDEIEISSGGGVRDIQDIKHLQQAHCNNVLVASAFHKGRINPEDLHALRDA